ncbi:MAG: RNA methyltransferase [Ignavibacteria bacterium CG_4_8_14_3_um_filter_37_9]|nr:RNA methyltransferase [Ignavibacteria bacterium]OIO20340.1 MAG: RNA methyltransferase [Ignavibacteria bacterium CG1_02_37_35]PIP76367.1 MAG: RNA methyltransferase [Ignavibacteria bacterium CG22_combo_CG10-13_8_21_14_all_37_15]PIS45662.1 MAG: RNA methyltransferase [Ignavibacteria bacterium CG08_land_8_20_14_0_20_37_9]PIW98625.1 MAG: RNA methyltransferase [Ignavibacteria bacterium CG_4_8_14_3_um_filter_37_9]PIX94304.1 MAG: RNA methyltransferase [Ignavibacteria bacterium CG_4_10_14_3_um_filter
MKKLTHDEISQNRSTVETVHQVEKLPVVALLDNIRSTYNVGSIFRTSDGAMIDKLFLTGYTPHPPNKEILKTALGSTNSVKWEFHKDALAVLHQLKKEGYKICALEQTETSGMYYDLSTKQFPLCLVIGNEITGVSQKLLDECDFAIEIPQYGIKQSLNVAVAYGIAIFELRKTFDLTGRQKEN